MATATETAVIEVERRDAAARGLHLAALVDASNDAIMSADADGIITTWNRAAEELYGYAKEEIAGQSVSVLCPLAKIGEQQRLLRAVAGGAVSIDFDTQRLHKDGSLLDVSVTDSRIMEGGSLTGFCAVTHDIGARIRSRDRLQEKIRVGATDLARARAETLQGLALAAEYRDYETSLHTERVGTLAARLAQTLGLGASFVALIGEAAPLHDVGKIGIPDSILLKPGRLTPAEFEAMKQHTVLGSALLAGSDYELLRLAGQIALTHHEHWNGKGYPGRLTGVAIPIAGRIVAVVDTYDAMTHERPYKSASTVKEALAELERCSGTQFDPRVVRAFQP
ncbi:MAG: PAS domain S-box protein [Actinomycetota bacterium]|nr:PAS domain S-box protein [Actinomycetota bacterium]